MKREKKKDLNRSVMLHEAWIEDGHTIGKLKHANAFLAERLAEAGLRPDDCPCVDMDVPGLAKAWLQAADIDAAMAFEQARG